MFIRVKTSATNDANVNVNHILSFGPASTGEGSVLNMTGGDKLNVLDSTRSIRGYVKKVLFAMHTGGASPDEAAEKAPDKA